ncbi:MAG: HetP family heterocyst commitment protein [Chloroflexaceae bacterium]|nr:HetP family heterocyst commitment protein [Chloroflexaceae bacterium]
MSEVKIVNSSAFNVEAKLSKTMTPEQFDQVVEAILAGKYSWACLLILRFAGYNPLHYIPYRTYNRLMKENRANNSAPKSRLEDLDYVKSAQSQNSKVFGGYGGWTFYKAFPGLGESN